MKPTIVQLEILSFIETGMLFKDVIKQLPYTDMTTRNNLYSLIDKGLIKIKVDKNNGRRYVISFVSKKIKPQIQSDLRDLLKLIS